MSTTSNDTVRRLLREHGRTYSAEVGFDPTTNKPAPLFKLLVLSLLLSARISADIATAAMRALLDAGWTTPAHMADSTWEQRTRVLNRSGYARYDESTSRMLGETTELLLDRWRGDLRRLREEAGRDPEQERALLREFKGIGDVGVDIFFREVQPAWTELVPFVDERARRTGRDLDLPDDPADLRGLVDSDDELARLVAALVRHGLSAR
jgi:endonuclease III